jgi:branched-chain amino acid aminotransferase
MAAWYYHDGVWTDKNPKLTGPGDHAFWMSSVVFDGARAFAGLAPDIDRHCERLVASARSLMLEPTLTAGEIAALCRDGARKFGRDAELYIRPMFYAEEGFILPRRESTRFVLAVYQTPMPPAQGFTAALSSFRRPARDMAPTDAKASCLYPNSARAIAEAQARGFDNAIVVDANGNVAEFATANLWIVRDGVAVTPAINGTFLNGITRQRVIGLLRDAGVAVEERAFPFAEVLAADEVFSTGNYGKVLPVTRVEGRDLQPGPVCARARDLYFNFARSAPLF